MKEAIDEKIKKKKAEEKRKKEAMEEADHGEDDPNSLYCSND